MHAPYDALAQTMQRMYDLIFCLVMAPIDTAVALLRTPRLGPLHTEQSAVNTNERHRRYCWWPLRLAWVSHATMSREPWWKERPVRLMLTTFGWECTSQVLGKWTDLPPADRPMTGSRARPHVFGWTVVAGPLRIIFGPPTRKYRTRKQLIARIIEVEQERDEYRERWEEERARANTLADTLRAIRPAALEAPPAVYGDQLSADAVLSFMPSSAGPIRRVIIGGKDQ